MKSPIFPTFRSYCSLKWKNNICKCVSCGLKSSVSPHVIQSSVFVSLQDNGCFLETLQRLWRFFLSAVTSDCFRWSSSRVSLMSVWRFVVLIYSFIYLCVRRRTCENIKASCDFPFISKQLKGRTKTGFRTLEHDQNQRSLLKTP